MLQKAFFKVDVVDRIYDTPVFEKTTPGAYEFTIPDDYNYVVVEYAGAGGGRAFNVSDNTPSGAPGNGSILKITKKITNRKITGFVGATPTKGVNTEYLGGAGYENGESSMRTGIITYTGQGGGGGGSTSVELNNIINEAGGGSGVCKSGLNLVTAGGKGGGQYGGAKTFDVNNGNNATDPNQIGLNSGDGYVKIWAGYDPYL